MRAAILLTCLSLVLVGCAHKRPEAKACAIQAFPIRSELKDPVRKAADEASLDSDKPKASEEDKPEKEPESYEEKVSAALRAQQSGAADANVPGTMLVLSGGSQNGAFGGGLLYGLEKKGDRTIYQVVTGVSTGSMQSTLAFLSEQPYAKRDLDDRGDGKYQLGRTNLEDLAAALSISKESTLLDKHRLGSWGAITSGSKGYLDPLKRRLLGLASEETLRAVSKAKKDDERLLMVGVTNLDDGYGYALDLTELASRIDPLDKEKRPGDAAEILKLRECYVEALVASSAVPIAAQPVMLNVVVMPDKKLEDHLFIDGGARYGVFMPSNTDPPTQVTMIVNGRLFGGKWKEVEEKEGAWTTLQLVERSVDILSNQVYRFSIDDVARYARDNQGTFRMAFISEKGVEDSGLKPPDEHKYTDNNNVTMTCAQWREHDKKPVKPLEFHPKYMACLLDYGVKRGESADPWNVEFDEKGSPVKPGANKP